ncbi:MAG: prepilin-type N-terminal cleavage/methylation domain-containing protein [Kiritimatiellae bacterium]|nr:prepilin-type N-terminal cleavage/methylation domain-containing protein [Kiritimatiellia bacterium]
MSGTRRSFTLIEMLVVVLVIGILAGIVFKLGAIVGNRSARVRTVNRLEHIKQCLEEYYKIYGEYPHADGVTWEKPFASHARPRDWNKIEDDLIKYGWKEYKDLLKERWSKLYPFLYEDKESYQWAEYREQVGGGWVGVKGYVIDSRTINPKFEYGQIIYSNDVYSICDAWGNEFYYKSTPPYQTYVLFSRGPDGNAFTSDDIGRESWTE